MTCGADEASAAGAAAQNMTGRGHEAAETDCGTDEAVEKHCGPMEMGPTYGADMSCGFEAEAGKSEAPHSIPTE